MEQLQKALHWELDGVSQFANLQRLSRSIPLALGPPVAPNTDVPHSTALGTGCVRGDAATASIQKPGVQTVTEHYQQPSACLKLVVVDVLSVLPSEISPCWQAAIPASHAKSHQLSVLHIWESTHAPCSLKTHHALPGDDCSHSSLYLPIPTLAGAFSCA
jgi:hypothetical protein